MCLPDMQTYVSARYDPNKGQIMHHNHQTGNAMLELILILPLYMVLLFVVCAVSEFGQVSTQLYITGRNIAWEKHGDDDEPRKHSCADEVDDAYDHFGARVVVKSSGGRMLVPLQEDGTEKGGKNLSSDYLIVAGAHAYSHYGLANPLYPVDSIYQDDADGANLDGLCSMAMRGSDVAAHSRTVPWLRRHYSSVWVTYKAFGGVFGLETTFRGFHTVLRSSTVATQDHAPYTISKHPSTLRDTAAYKYNKIVNLALHNHQMDMLGSETDFEPDKP